MKTQMKQAIYDTLNQMKIEMQSIAQSMKDVVVLSAYRSLAEPSAEGVVWTKALQKALDEHQTVIIEPSQDVYFLDHTVVIPSDRMIEATGATIRLTANCDLLMLRNEHTKDGTHMPPSQAERDQNIVIHGGRWEEPHSARAGYGVSGRYAPRTVNDEKRPFYGVSTCMLFNHMENLMLSDMTFVSTAGFSVQIGDLENGVFERISFEHCYADGLHINGGTKNLFISDIQGEVGDDLVALNAYDWQNSSVNFGPIDMVLCRNLTLAETSRYKAIRIEPGVYRYDDASTVDCGLFNIIFQNVKGIRTFKMYLQTPPYDLDDKPEWGEAGSVDNIFFEDIAIDLRAPIDHFGPYRDQNAVRGTFGAFELGANIGYLSFKNIDLTLYPEKWKYGYLVCIGPKSTCLGQKEIFDPYVSGFAETLVFENILVNGETPQDPLALIKEIVFDDVNGDGNSTGKGEIRQIIWNGMTIRPRE